MSLIREDVRRLVAPSGRPFFLLYALLGGTLFLGAGFGFLLDEGARREVVTAFEEAMPDTDGGYFEELLELFIHNFMISLVMLAAGLWLKFIPQLILGFNGVAIGLILCCYAEGSVAGTLAAFAFCLPHGVFELTSFVGVACLALQVNSWKRLPPGSSIGGTDLRWVARCVWYVAIFDLIAAAIEAGLMVALQ